MNLQVANGGFNPAINPSVQPVALGQGPAIFREPVRSPAESDVVDDQPVRETSGEDVNCGQGDGFWSRVVKAAKFGGIGGLVAFLILILLGGGCGDDDGDGNHGNNNRLDAGNDAMADVFDGGTDDASGLDGGVKNCYDNEDRKARGIDDGFEQLIVNQQSCEVKDMVRRDSQGDFLLLCANPSNRVWRFDPAGDQGSRLSHFAQLLPNSQGICQQPGGQPQYYSGDLYPTAITSFTQSNTNYVLVSAQTENSQHPCAAKGVAYMFDQFGNSLDGKDLQIPIVGPTGTDMMKYFDPNAAFVSQGQACFDFENYNRPYQTYVQSLMACFPLDCDATGCGFSTDTPIRVTPDPNGHTFRGAGMAELNNNTVVNSYAGIANATVEDAEPAKIAFSSTDTTDPQSTALRTYNLDLGNQWELVRNPRISKTSNRKNFILVAKKKIDGTQDANKPQKIVVVNVNNPDDPAGAQINKQMTAEIPAGVGPVKKVIVDDARGLVYITLAGDISKGVEASLLEYTLDTDTGTISQNPTGVVKLGFNGGVSGFDSSSGLIYTTVGLRKDCTATDNGITSGFIQELNPADEATDPDPFDAFTGWNQILGDS